MKNPVNKISRDDVDFFKEKVNLGYTTLDLYQSIAGRSAIYPGRNTIVGLWYCLTKLNSEAGEAAEHIGKAFRDNNALVPMPSSSGLFTAGELTAERTELLMKELGDALWYLARASAEMGLSLSEIAIGNLDKLASRTERGELSGSGDDR